MCVCARACLGAHISLCLSSCICVCVCVGLNVCVCAPAWKIKKGTQIRTICTVFTTCNKVPGSNQSHILLNFVSCLCTVASQRAQRRGHSYRQHVHQLGTAPQCHREERRLLKWLPPGRQITAPSRPLFALVSRHSLS